MPLRPRLAGTVFAGLLLPAGLLAQAAPAGREGPRIGWFPTSFAVQPMPALHSGVDLGTAPLVVDRDPPGVTGGEAESGAEGDVAFGYRIPVYRFRDGSRSGPAVDLGLEAGLLARFALGKGLNGLLNSDFRVAFPLGADFGALEARLALVHVSSHAGDDYIAATPSFTPRAVSRNGVEARLFWQLGPSLRAIGGVDYNWAAVRTEEVAARVGLTFDPAAASRRLRPVARIEAEVSDYTAGPSVTGFAGIAFPSGEGDIELGATAHTGPSQMGQFRTRNEEYVGVSVQFVPGPVVRSADRTVAGR